MTSQPPPSGPPGSQHPAAPAPPPAEEFLCARCGRAGAPRLARPPLPGATGREVQATVCADCWGEWGRAEVMVINELRLNFMDPASQAVLDKQMREFLHLGGGGGATPPAAPETPGSSTPGGPGQPGGPVEAARRGDPGPSSGPGQPGKPGGPGEPGQPGH